MRVVVFGVDGLTFRILDPLIAQGFMPHFRSVRDGGVQCVLKSTVPPMTPPAWMTIATGLPPASHGVYDFWEYEQAEHSLVPRVMTHRKGGKAIWNILSDWGKRVIVANAPLTYPPEPVQGIMLSGYMAPSMRASVTYPRGFKDELLQSVPEYKIDLDPAISGGQIGDPLVATLEMTQARIAMLRLLLTKSWDFCFVVFSGADRIQHLCWDKVRAFHPQAVAYYQLLDEALGLLLSALGDDDLLLIVSDHGFQGVQRKFYLQEYLYRHGWLRMGRRQRCRALLPGLGRRSLRSLRLQNCARLLRRQLHSSGLLAVEKEPHTTALPNLDWKRTSAWVPSSSGSLAGYADIFLADTLSDEEIQHLLSALQEVHDPETGLKLFAEIYREEVYGSGPFVPPGRHLIVIANEQTALATELGRDALWEVGDSTSGIHHPDGVLYLYGAQSKRGIKLAPSTVYDVVPTILWRMGLPLPGHLYGKVIHDAYEQSLPVTSARDRGGIAMQKLQELDQR